MTILTLNKDNYREIFKKYILDGAKKLTPVRINLPRDILIQLLGNSGLEKNYIDLDWYNKDAYRDHPLSTYKNKNKKSSYIEEYNKWRKNFKFPVQNNFSLKLNNPRNFKDILKFAQSEKRAIVLGESHNHRLPKLLLIQYIEILKEDKAALFIEGLPKELQKEFTESVNLKKATPIIELFLQNQKDEYDLGAYSYTEIYM